MKAGKPGSKLLSVTLCALITLLVIKLAVTVIGALYSEPETTIAVPEAMAKDEKPKAEAENCCAGRESGQNQARDLDFRFPERLSAERDRNPQKRRTAQGEGRAAEQIGKGNRAEGQRPARASKGSSSQFEPRSRTPRIPKSGALPKFTGR